MQNLLNQKMDLFTPLSERSWGEDLSLVLGPTKGSDGRLRPIIVLACLYPMQKFSHLDDFQPKQIPCITQSL